MDAPWLLQAGIACAGLALAAVVALAARRWFRRDPTLGYTFSVALLVGTLALPAVQCAVRGLGHARAAPWREWWRTTFTPPATAPRADRELLRTPADAADEALFAEESTLLVQREAVDLTPLVAAAAQRSSAGTRNARRAERPPAAFHAGLIERGEFAEHAPSAAGEWFAGVRARLAAIQPSEWLAAAVGTWLLGVLLLAGLRARRFVRTLRLLRRTNPVTDPALQQLWDELVREEPAAARATLRISSAVASPACFGWRRPVLLVPAVVAPQLSLDALRWALRHELVHVARGDGLVAAAQALATTLFWFHPAAWWLSAEVSRLRELSCDLAVVERCGRRKSYAHALLEHAAALHGHSTAIDAGPHSAGVRCALLHWGRSPTQIERRIEMLASSSNGMSRARRLGGRLLAGSLFALPLLTQVGAAATLVPGDEPVAPPSGVAVAATAPIAPVAPIASRAPIAPVAPMGASAAPSGIAPIAAPAVNSAGGDERAPSASAGPRVRRTVRRPVSAPAALPPSGEGVCVASADAAPAAANQAAVEATQLADLASAISAAAARGDHEQAHELAQALKQYTHELAKHARTNRAMPTRSAVAGPACADPCTSASTAECDEPCEERCAAPREDDCAVTCESSCDEAAALDEFAPFDLAIDFEDFAGFEEFAELEELDDLSEEFVDLADDLEGDFADLGEELAELSVEMGDLASASEGDEFERCAVAGELDAARAEIELALAQAQTDVELELADARCEVADALAELRDGSDGRSLDETQRAAVERAVNRAMAQAQQQAATALARSREQAARAVEAAGQARAAGADAAKRAQAVKRAHDHATRALVDAGPSDPAATRAGQRAAERNAAERQRALAEAQRERAARDAVRTREARDAFAEAQRLHESQAAEYESASGPVAPARAKRTRAMATAERQAQLQAQIAALQQELARLKGDLIEANPNLPATAPAPEPVAPTPAPVQPPRVKRRGTGVR